VGCEIELILDLSTLDRSSADRRFGLIFKQRCRFEENNTGTKCNYFTRGLLFRYDSLRSVPFA
jgi:hypothetical protein